MTGERYYIKLKDADAEDGWRYPQIPSDARVLDGGYCLKVVRLCTCECGDQHDVVLAVFYRHEVISARVTKDGLSMNIWSESDVETWRSELDRKAIGG